MNFFFCTQDFRAQLESGSELQIVIIPTMILDSLENIRLKKEKSLWMESLPAAFARRRPCLVAWDAVPQQPWQPKLRRTKISEHLFEGYFCWFRDPELQFCTEMGDRMIKQLHRACTARGTKKGEISFCLKRHKDHREGTQVSDSFDCHVHWRVLKYMARLGQECENITVGAWRTAEQ